MPFEGVAGKHLVGNGEALLCDHEGYQDLRLLGFVVLGKAILAQLVLLECLKKQVLGNNAYLG
jgi:hypothetical protein